MKTPSGSSRGKVVDAQVRTTDILPTVVDLTRVTQQAQFDGESLKPYLTGTSSSDRVAFGETDYPLRFGWAPLKSVRSAGFKLIDAPKPELYNLQTDPKELTNTYTAGNPTVQKLSEQLSTLKSAAAATNAASLPDPKGKIDEQNLLHSAMMAEDDNRTDDSRAAYEKVLQMDPKSPTALRQLGELELHAGNYAKAAEYLKRSREVRPDDATAAFYEGQAREKAGDLAGARDALEASLKLTPGQLPARILLGNIYLALKDSKAADDQFEAALLVDSNNVDAQIGVARAQIAQSNFTDALAQLEPLSKAQPTNAEVFEALSQAYAGAGKPQEAQQAEATAKRLRTK
jgi:tetratricopeptide (TPR) repeat protein